MIDNPNYQGKWEPRKIANPEYFEETNPFSSLTPFSALGLELWSMTENIYFDNFIITNDEQVAKQFANDSWSVRQKLEAAKSKVKSEPEAPASDSADVEEAEAETDDKINDEL
jgi:hypothetical protein